VPREDAFEVEGTVIEVLKDILYRVELSNGHRLLAHFGRKLRARSTRFLPGDKLKIEVSPFDLSKGRIVLPKQERDESTSLS
jgi:translation initiation factor IF-1